MIYIASRQRSGTHFLLSLLGSCPGVYAFPCEPFHPDYRGLTGYWDGKTDPATWLRQQAGEDTPIFAGHPGWCESDPRILPSIMPTVTHAIILYRRDLLAGYVSLRLAEQNWEWGCELDAPPTHGTIEVDRDGLTERSRIVRESLAVDQERWPNHQILAYEDLVGNLRSTLDDLGRWLKIDTEHASSDRARKERRPLSEVVTNYLDARAWAAELAVA